MQQALRNTLKHSESKKNNERENKFKWIGCNISGAGNREIENIVITYVERIFGSQERVKGSGKEYWGGGFVWKANFVAV